MPESGMSVEKNPGLLLDPLAGVNAVRGLYAAIDNARQIEASAREALELLADQHESVPPDGYQFSVISFWGGKVYVGRYENTRTCNSNVGHSMVDPEVVEIEKGSRFTANRIVVSGTQLLAVAADGSCRAIHPQNDHVAYEPTPEPAE